MANENDTYALTPKECAAYTPDETAAICEFANIGWQRGQKCQGCNKFVTVGIWRESVQMHIPDHDAPPPDLGDPKIAAWVAMECLRQLSDHAVGLQTGGSGIIKRWSMSLDWSPWIEDDDPIAAIFAAVLAFVKKKEQS